MSVALVTGGSRGIGRVIAEKLASAGFNIAICYSGNESAAQETIELCKKHGVRGNAPEKSAPSDFFASLLQITSQKRLSARNADCEIFRFVLRFHIVQDFYEIFKRHIFCLGKTATITAHGLQGIFFDS